MEIPSFHSKTEGFDVLRGRYKMKTPPGVPPFIQKPAAIVEGVSQYNSQQCVAPERQERSHFHNYLMNATIYHGGENTGLHVQENVKV